VSRMDDVKIQFGEAAWLSVPEIHMGLDGSGNMAALKAEILDVVESGVVYGIFEVTAPFEKKPFLISGNLLKLSNYLTDAAKQVAKSEQFTQSVAVRLVGFTTDRNEARKKAEEV